MQPTIEHETNIVWLEDPAQFRYVREFDAICTAKRGWRKKLAAGRRVVAYAELSPGGQNSSETAITASVVCR